MHWCWFISKAAAKQPKRGKHNIPMTVWSSTRVIHNITYAKEFLPSIWFAYRRPFRGPSPPKNMTSPEPAQTALRPSKIKIKEKSKKKSKSQPVTVTGHGKNEGENPHWAYKPPPGSHLYDHLPETDTFDWDSVQKDDDIEIWLIRVPDSVSVR